MKKFALQLYRRGGWFILPFCFLMTEAHDTRAADFTFETHHTRALELLHQYQTEEARELIQANQQDAVSLYLLQLSYQLPLLFSENEINWEVEKDRFSQCIEQLEEFPAHPYKQLFLSDLHFYQAAARFKRAHLYKGSQLLLKAYRHSEKGAALYPDEPFYIKWQSVTSAAFASVPSVYKWIADLFGFEGNSKKALQDLEALSSRNFISKERQLWQRECNIILSFFYIYLQQKPEKARLHFAKSFQQIKNGPIHQLAFNSIDFKNRKGLAILQRRDPGQFSKIPMLAYQSGLAGLHHLNQDSRKDFENFIRLNESGLYLQTSWQKLSWLACLQNDSQRFEECLNAIIKLGKGTNDEDKQAYAFALQGAMPDRRLLKLRLLYDGGFDDEAYQEVKAMHYKDFSKAEEQVEYLYRKARIFEAAGHEEVALKFYEACLKKGWQMPDYYAMKSSVLIAEFYEKNGQNEQARHYFEKALSNKDCKLYKNSIEQQAKAGLSRL